MPGGRSARRLGFAGGSSAAAAAIADVRGRRSRSAAAGRLGGPLVGEGSAQPRSSRLQPPRAVAARGRGFASAAGAASAGGSDGASEAERVLHAGGYTGPRAADRAGPCTFEDEPPRWMLLGAPGAGKGTYSKLLSAAFGGVPLVGMGDMMRAEIASRSKLGRLLKGYNDEGTLCPDEHSVAMLEARLESPWAAKSLSADLNINALKTSYNLMYL